MFNTTVGSTMLTKLEPQLAETAEFFPEIESQKRNLKKKLINRQNLLSLD